MRHPRAYALLVLAVAVHALLLWRAGGHWQDLDHDSTISYLAATGHEGDYARLPADRWIVADDVQRLFRVDDRWPLRRIRDDLARFDIHPPLYFWLLHAQFLASGATPWAFIVLNFILGALTLVVVYSIGRRLWGPSSGAAAALLWAVSFGALITALNARPYALAALLSLLLLRLALFAHEGAVRPTLARGVLLGLVMLAGLLTLYQFPLVIAAVGAGFVLADGRGRPRRAVVFGAAAFLALAVFEWLHPGFVESLARQRAQTQAFAVSDLPWRIKRFSLGLLGLARPAREHLALTIASALLVLAAAWLAARGGALRRLPEAWRLLHEASAGVKLLAWTAVALTILEALLYLGHVAPAHAVGDRYNATLWPLFALLFVGAMRALAPGRVPVLLLATAIFMQTYPWASNIDAEQRALPDSPVWRALAAARTVVADHAQRGALPRAVLHAPADSRLWIVGSATDVDSLIRDLRAGGAAATFLLNPVLGDPRVRPALERSAAAGDSLVPAGVVAGETEVLGYAPCSAPRTSSRSPSSRP